MILPKKKLGKGKWSKAGDLKKVLAVGMTDEQLAARLGTLKESITYQVFHYARRGLFERHKLVLATQLVLKVLRREGKLAEAEASFLLNGPKLGGPSPPISTQAASFLGEAQWSACAALAEMSLATSADADAEPSGRVSKRSSRAEGGVFNKLCEDIEMHSDEWKEWVDSDRPEDTLPEAWDGKLSALQKLLLLRALRPDRVTSALAMFVKSTLGEKYIDEEPFNMRATYDDSSTPTPLFFTLFPGVDPGADIEALGADLGYTEANGRYVSISMGQGQEAHAEASLERMAKEGGWVFLQNVHLMQSWLPKLERKLELAAASGHDEFRCFMSAEPPPLPEQQTIPEGILQSAIKVAREPPADLKANLRSAYALFSQQTLDASSAPNSHGPMLFALCFFHSLALGRRKFGYQGFSRSYPFNNGDLTVCASVLHNYLEKARDVPWADCKYNFGEIMYGGHITDFWDRRITSTYLEVLLQPRLVTGDPPLELAPGYVAPRDADYLACRMHIEEKLPAESPVLFGLHPNSQISLLQTTAAELFLSINVMSGGGGGGGGGGLSRETKASQVQHDLSVRLPEDFNMFEIKSNAKKAGELTPYAVCVLQELERCNLILEEMRRALAELELGLTGALNISDTMDALISCLSLNQARLAPRAVPTPTPPPDPLPPRRRRRAHPTAAPSAGAPALAQDLRPDRPDGHVQPQVARLVVRRPAPPRQAAARLGRRGRRPRAPAVGLDLGAVQPDGLRHRVPAGDRARQGPRARLDGDTHRGDVQAAGRRAVAARGGHVRPRPLHGGRAVGRRGGRHRREPPEGAPPADAGHAHQGRHQGGGGRRRRVHVPSVHDHHPRPHVHLRRAAAHRPPRARVDSRRRRARHAARPVSARSIMSWHCAVCDALLACA